MLPSVHSSRRPPVARFTEMLAAGRAPSVPTKHCGSPHLDRPATRPTFSGRAGVWNRCDNPPRASPEIAGTSTSSDRPTPALILIGGRGCGKSALCRRLVAADSRFKLRSLDDMIVEQAGMDIPEIVENHGWRWFRDLEFKVCQRVAEDARRASVLNTSTDNSNWTLIDAGGGVVVDLDESGNEVYSTRKVDALRGRHPITGARENVLVYIKRDVRYLMNRTSGDKNRPDLSKRTPFADIMNRRMPWYFDAADYVVDATGGCIESEVKSKFAIRDEVLEFFYAETGGWPSEGGEE